MDLSIIIVNWKSKEYLRKCLFTITATTHDIAYEILVIDAASFDGSEEMVRQSYPQVRFVQSKENRGFAGANNEAFKMSSGRNVLFLNPDTEIEGDAIRAMLSYLTSRPEAGIVGPKLLNTDKTVQTTCVRAFPTILNQVLDVDFLQRLFPRSGLWGTAPLWASTDKPAEVDAISGACMMIKRSLFESVGMFSTDYFMYSEDIDLCLKVHASGRRTYFIPAAVVVHHGGKSTVQSGVSVFSSVMMMESRWRYFRKTRTLWYSRMYCFAMGCVSLLRLGLLLAASWIRKSTPSPDPALIKWRARLRWTLGCEIWVKDYQGSSVAFLSKKPE